MNTEFAKFDATCHTENCGNAEATISIDAIADEPNVVCGVCGNKITDVQPK